VRLAQMGELEESIPWNSSEPPLWSIAKPFHHTREPKVGSRVGVRPEVVRLAQMGEFQMTESCIHSGETGSA
jgi:hypothetical protein